MSEAASADWQIGDTINVSDGPETYRGKVVHVERDDDGEPLVVVSENLDTGLFHVLPLAGWKLAKPSDLN